MLPELRAGRHISRAYLGLRAVGDGAALRVVSVTPHSPADRGGVVPGDLLLAADGQPLATPAELQRALDVRAGGQDVELALKRADGDHDAVVTLADWAQQPVVAAGMTLVPAMNRFGCRPGARFGPAPQVKFG